MQHVKASVGGNSVLSCGEHPTAVPLTIFLLPHDSVFPYVPHDTRDECVIALVHVHWKRLSVADARHARCNMKTFWLKDLKSTGKRYFFIQDY
jgi:hypothetical protein